jgi:shikimate kinase
MGSGKTTVGKQLAHLLKYEFIDLDEMIERGEGKTISETFETHGEDYFRQKESEYLKSIEPSLNAVVATGGGAPCFFDNMQWMNHHGITIYLKGDPDFLFQRLYTEKDHRPLLKGKSDDEFRAFIVQKLSEREIFYSQCQLVVDADLLEAENIFYELKEKKLV